MSAAPLRCVCGQTNHTNICLENQLYIMQIHFKYSQEASEARRAQDQVIADARANATRAVEDAQQARAEAQQARADAHLFGEITFKKERLNLTSSPPLIVGKEFQRIREAVETQTFSTRPNKDPTKDKDTIGIVYVLAPPRHGKSLILDQAFKGTPVKVVSISFNGNVQHVTLPTSADATYPCWILLSKIFASIFGLQYANFSTRLMGFNGAFQSRCRASSSSTDLSEKIMDQIARWYWPWTNFPISSMR